MFRRLVFIELILCFFLEDGLATAASLEALPGSPTAIAEDRCAGAFDLVVSRPQRDVFWEGCLAYPDKDPPVAYSQSRICARIRNSGCGSTPLFTNRYRISYAGRDYHSFAVPFERINPNDFTVICTSEPVRVETGPHSTEIRLDPVNDVAGEADELNLYTATLTAETCPSLPPPCRSSATYDSTTQLSSLGDHAYLSQLGKEETASLQVLSDSYLCDWRDLPDGSLTRVDFTPAGYQNLSDASQFADAEIAGSHHFDGRYIADGVYLDGHLLIRTIERKKYAAWTDHKAHLQSTRAFPLTFSNFAKVFIDNVHIYSKGNENIIIGLTVIDTEEAIIKNSTFLGELGTQADVRTEGVKRVVADRLRFSGIDGQKRTALFVNNGDQKALGTPSCGDGKGASDEEGFCYRLDPGYPELQALIIQNSEFTGNSTGGVAVHVHTPSNGLLFNSVARNWLKGDYYVWDLGFRTHSFRCNGGSCSCADGDCETGDNLYKQQNVVYRIERNITWDSGGSKNTGGFGNSQNKLLWANNIFFSSGALAEAQNDWIQWKDNIVKSPDVYRLHNTFVPGSDVYTGLWGKYFVVDPKNLYFENNLVLVRSDSPMTYMYFANDLGDTDSGGYAKIYKDKALSADYNLYVADKNFSWIRRLAGPDEDRFETWREGPPYAEAHGRCYGMSCGDTTYTTADVVENAWPSWSERLSAFTPGRNSPALESWNPLWADYSVDKRLRVDRDFGGRFRGTRPGENAVGAFVRPDDAPGRP